MNHEEQLDQVRMKQGRCGPAGCAHVPELEDQEQVVQ